MTTFCFKKKKKHKLFVSKKKRNVKLLFEEGQEEKKTTALFQKKNTKRLFFRFGQKKQKTIKSFCFFVSGKRKEAEEKRETFVYLFQEKKGLFQEQAGLLVSRTAQRIKTFVYLFQEKKGLFQEQEGLLVSRTASCLFQEPRAACFKKRSKNTTRKEMGLFCCSKKRNGFKNCLFQEFKEKKTTICFRNTKLTTNN